MTLAGFHIACSRNPLGRRFDLTITLFDRYVMLINTKNGWGLYWKLLGEGVWSQHSNPYAIKDKLA